MIKRFITQKILDALTDRPVVFINGARQVGKSTLVQWLAENDHPAIYFSFDELSTLSLAKSDPGGFIAGLSGNVIIDEVQRVPELFYVIKSAVDQDRTPGRFLLTGSANMMVLPKLSDALVGRMEVITLSPFSLGEIYGNCTNLVDMLFTDELIHPEKKQDLNLVKTIAFGGFPDVQTIKKTNRRRNWFDSYVTTLIQRDVRDISQIHGIMDLPRLLQILAPQTGQLLNMANISRRTGIEQKTLKRYLVLLEAVFLISFLPAWFANIGKRLIKTPKVYFNDTGILSHLLGSEPLKNSDYFGQMVENFVLMELKKQAQWSETSPKFYYYRTSNGIETDIVMENTSGKIVAIEVKATSTLKPDAARGIKDLKNAVPNRFHRGIIFYMGDLELPIEQNILAVPIPSLG